MKADSDFEDNEEVDSDFEDNKEADSDLDQYIL